MTAVVVVNDKLAEDVVDVPAAIVAVVGIVVRADDDDDDNEERSRLHVIVDGIRVLSRKGLLSLFRTRFFAFLR